MVEKKEETKQVSQENLRYVVKEVPTQTEKVFVDQETDEVYDMFLFINKMMNDLSIIKKQLVGK